MSGAEPGGFGGKPGIGLEGFDAANGCCGPRTPGRAQGTLWKRAQAVETNHHWATG